MRYGKPILEVKFDGTESLKVDKATWVPIAGQNLNRVERKPISDDRKLGPITINNLVPPGVIPNYSKLDAEIARNLMGKGFFVGWSKACTVGRVSSTEPNGSNQPKPEQKALQSYAFRPPGSYIGERKTTLTCERVWDGRCWQRVNKPGDVMMTKSGKRFTFNGDSWVRE
jgi:hypothetical protein